MIYIIKTIETDRQNKEVYFLFVAIVLFLGTVGDAGVCGWGGGGREGS